MLLQLGLKLLQQGQAVNSHARKAADGRRADAAHLQRQGGVRQVLQSVVMQADEYEGSTRTAAAAASAFAGQLQQGCWHDVCWCVDVRSDEHGE